MFFGKYNLLIIKEKTGSTRSMSIRAEYLWVAFVLMFVLLAGNIYFLRNSTSDNLMQSQLDAAELLLEERENQLISLAADAMRVKDSLSRMQQFNAKLRIMINMENDPVMSGIGGSRSEEFELGILPLHRQELASRKIRSFIKELATAVRLEEVHQQDILLSMREHENFLASMPTIIPVDGFLSSRFGSRPNPFTGRPDFHKGLDVAAATGTPIYAPARGKVVFTGENSGYGNTIEISHGSGITTRYAHLSRYNVSRGQEVERYDIIGYVGSSGRATGPHLHYEVRINGVPTDPMAYILNR